MSWLPVTLLVAVIAGVIGAGYWFWQHRELNLARTALEKKEYQQAIAHADLVIAFGWEKSAAQELRSLAFLKLTPEAALETLAAADKSTITPELGLAYLRQSLKDRKFDRVESIYEALGPTLGGEPEYLFLQAQIEFLRNHTKQAMESLDRLLAIDPKHTGALLLKGQYLLAQPTPLASLQAKSFLRRAGSSHSEEGFKALILLGSRFDIPMFENDREWLLQSLDEHAKQTPLSRIVIATQQLILTPDQRDTIIQNTVQSEGVAEPDLVANWLLSIGAYDAMLKFINSPAAAPLQADQRWRAQFQALIGQGQVDEAVAVLNEEARDLDQLKRATLLAHIESSRQVSDTPTQAWRHAYQIAEKQQAYDELMSLAGLSFRLGWINESITATQAALQTAEEKGQKSRALNQLFIIHATQRQTQEALDAINQYLALQPDNHAMRNNALYLDALLATPSQEKLDQMQALVEEHPNSIYPASYAFMLWKVGQLDAAEHQLEHLNRRYLKVASCRLSNALVALDRQDRQTAEAMLNSMSANQLLPEEKLLFEQASERVSQL
ncbi:tetratricopeptide repeat protein [Cerasicoccus maritimus]|uniref:tetratricopeptide repeat protein n=1 Tax=Cerasicoccus maritimus TaxID=490089 RepID=UPI0028529243|nr:hypothetical protein [Cerasicoccus maritimus]